MSKRTIKKTNIEPIMKIGERYSLDLDKKEDCIKAIEKLLEETKFPKRIYTDCSDYSFLKIIEPNYDLSQIEFNFMLIKSNGVFGLYVCRN